MHRLMAQNGREGCLFCWRLLGVNKGWELRDGRVALLASGRVVVFEVEHGDGTGLPL